MPVADPAPAAHCLPFLLIHALLIPAVLALAAVAARNSGIDERVTAMFYVDAAGTFPARASTTLELAGHRLAKSAILAVWMILLAAAMATSIAGKFENSRAVLWATLIAMALGPSVVFALKHTTSFHCPWDLRRFGGFAELDGIWFVSPAQAGRCFPSGHAAAGFSLVALMFAGIAEGRARLRKIGLIAAVCAGAAFGMVRTAQGAHFLSHNLWSAAIDWCAAALAFAPLLVHRNWKRRMYAAEH